MIHRLRKKFIRLCMLSFMAVFLLLFLAVFIVTELQVSATLDNLADLIAANGGQFPDPAGLGASGGFPFPLAEVTQESPFTTRFFIVRLDGAGQVSSADIRAIASVTLEEAADYAREALERGRNRGWLGDFRYKVYVAEEETAVVFVNGRDARAATRRLLFSGAAVFAGGSLVVLLLVVLFSRQAVKPAAESYEKQRLFITNASHALKTPLTLIRANLDILEADGGPSEWIDDIREETDTLTGLVNQLVSLSRMEEEGQLEMVPFSLSSAAEETAAAFAPGIRGAGKELRCAIAQGVEYVGNEGAIRQLLSLLLDNAARYCDAGGCISLTLTGGKHPVLTLENPYAGVDHLELGRLFDRFYRGDPAQSRGSGFGIGLSIARAIVEKHRGEITVQQPARGQIRFRVRL